MPIKALDFPKGDELLQVLKNKMLIPSPGKIIQESDIATPHELSNGSYRPGVRTSKSQLGLHPHQPREDGLYRCGERNQTKSLLWTKTF